MLLQKQPSISALWPKHRCGGCSRLRLGSSTATDSRRRRRRATQIPARADPGRTAFGAGHGERRRLSAAACAKKAAGRRQRFFQIDSVFFAKIDGGFFRFSRKVLRNAPTLAIRNLHKAENEICEVCPLSVERYPRWEPWSECSCSGIQDRSRRIVRCRRWISAQAASAGF